MSCFLGVAYKESFMSYLFHSRKKYKTKTQLLVFYVNALLNIERVRIGSYNEREEYHYMFYESQNASKPFQIISEQVIRTKNIVNRCMAGFYGT